MGKRRPSTAELRWISRSRSALAEVVLDSGGTARRRMGREGVLTAMGEAWSITTEAAEEEGVLRWLAARSRPWRERGSG